MLPVDQDLVAGRGIGVAGHTGHTPAGAAARAGPPPAGGGTPADVGKAGTGKVGLTPPPVAPPLGLFHTFSAVMVVGGVASGRVPPQAGACGLERASWAGCGPSVWPSVLPLSPLAAHTVTPSAAASAKAWSIAVRAWAVHWSSDWPQLMLTADGVGVACTAVLTASRKPRSVFGAKYTSWLAPGASAPTTSMSSMTSPSAELGSPVGVFLPPSTSTALTCGRGTFRPAK